MRARTAIAVIPTVLVVIALVLYLLPAPDPLGNADTVYVELPGTEAGSSDISALQEQLSVVLNDRNLEIVTDRSSADVVLAITEANLNLADVEFSISRGEVSGHAKAVLTATHVDSGRTYTMDLVLRAQDGRLNATLRARKFYEFWK